MKNFFAQLANAAIAAAIQGAASASSSGADLKTVGVSAGITSIAGVLAFLLQHPIGTHPAVVAAVATQTSAPTPAA